MTDGIEVLLPPPISQEFKRSAGIKWEPSDLTYPNNPVATGLGVIVNGCTLLTETTVTEAAVAAVT